MHSNSPLDALPTARTAGSVALPLLVTGIAGVPGYNALDYFRQRFPGQVIGIRQRDNWKLVGPDIVACSAEDRDELARLFDKHQFRSVLDAAGNCALRACELDRDRAFRINVDGVRNLLEVVRTREVRLVHLSSDLVYSGNRTPEQGAGRGYLETDPVDPVTVYGQTMVASEQLVEEFVPSACSLRISLPMGVSFSGHAGAIDWIQSRFKKFRPATLYYDEFRTPTYTDCLNALYETLLSNRLAGLFHGGAPRRTSLYEIGQVVNRVGGYAPENLMGCMRVQAGPIPPRAGDVCMDSSKLVQALGFQPFTPWPYDEQFVPTHHDWHHERSAGWRGSPALLEEILYRNPLLRLRSA